MGLTPIDGILYQRLHRPCADCRCRRAPAIEYLATCDQNAGAVSRVNAAKVFEANVDERSANSLRAGAVCALRRSSNSNRLQIRQ